MSNERIDLTQFEGINEWEVEKRPDGGYAIKTGRDNFSLEEAETIVKLPTLIAELKKCYEEIDALRSITQDWVKIETFTDDGKDLSVDMEDSDGNCFSGYINRASE